MEEGRQLYLIAKAIFKGYLPAKEVDTSSLSWWRKCRLATKMLDYEINQAIESESQKVRQGLLGNSSLTSHSFNKIQEEANSSFMRSRYYLAPWTGTPAQAQQREIERLTEQYVKEHGDPSTPEYQENLKKWSDAYFAREAAAIAEQRAYVSSDELISRKMQERQNKRRAAAKELTKRQR